MRITRMYQTTTMTFSMIEYPQLSGQRQTFGFNAFGTWMMCIVCMYVCMVFFFFSKNKLFTEAFISFHFCLFFLGRSHSFPFSLVSEIEVEKRKKEKRKEKEKKQKREECIFQSKNKKEKR